MQRWEYQIVESRHVHQSYLEPILNDHGDQGWELVGCYFQPNLTTFVFKRPAGEVVSAASEAVA